MAVVAVAVAMVVVVVVVVVAVAAADISGRHRGGQIVTPSGVKTRMILVRRGLREGEGEGEREEEGRR